MKGFACSFKAVLVTFAQAFSFRRMSLKYVDHDWFFYASFGLKRLFCRLIDFPLTLFPHTVRGELTGARDCLKVRFAMIEVEINASNENNTRLPQQLFTRAS
jgi:hypothetical protein